MPDTKLLEPSAGGIPRHTDTADVIAREVSTDGRVARRQRNRERVVDGYVQLLREGVFSPTADDVAERAQVTARSVYRYLHEDPTLKFDVVQRILVPLRTTLSLDDVGELPLPDRIEAFISFRLDFYSQAAPIVRPLLTDLAWDPAAATAMDTNRVALQQQLMTVFANELDVLPAEKRADIFAVHTLLQCESLDHLHQHLTMDEAKAVLARQLHAALTIKHAQAPPTVG